MNSYKVSHAAELLGVSDDTVRRLIDAGTLPTTAASPIEIPGAVLAEYAASLADEPNGAIGIRSSARNRFVGLVTGVVIDGLMAQVELQSGPHRVVSLMSAEAARELCLEPGSLAVAAVKATQVTVEVPRDKDARRG